MDRTRATSLPLLVCKGSGSAGVAVVVKALKAALGDDAALHPSLKRPGKEVDPALEASIRAWQTGVGVVADGVVGPYAQSLLGLRQPAPELLCAWPLTLNRVVPLFPQTKPANIARYLPYLGAALASIGMTDRVQLLGALALLKASAEGFVPISGRFPNGQAGDPRYHPRGWVGLSGFQAYSDLSKALASDLLSHPAMANGPEVASLVLALTVERAWKQSGEDALAARLRTTLPSEDAGALARFDSVWHLAAVSPAWEPSDASTSNSGVARARSGTAPSRRAAPSRRGQNNTPVERTEPPAQHTSTPSSARARKDAVDVRDRLYTPPPISLPAVHPSPADVSRHLPAYTQAGLILNQGQEGSCTGFGLACVVNYLRWMRAGRTKKLPSVSPHMLYTMARRYDEYEGEDYDGSSCRGAIKGWFYNGVCSLEDWPDAPRYGFAERSADTSLGVYYRIDITSVTDMQAAICQHGAIYVSVYTHDGWDAVPYQGKKIVGHDDIPVIAFDGRPHRSGGHAFALVGFNGSGFLLQNSWGADWGAGGFATLSYADWLCNAMDAWVVALGVPRVIAGRLTVPPSTARRAQHKDEETAQASHHTGWWDETQALQHSVVLGDDGRVARYLTEDAAPRKLMHQVFNLPDRWFGMQPAGQPKRLVLYVHGGLNSEVHAISRARAMGRYFLGNGCYPLFVVWKTGLWESLLGLLSQSTKTVTAASGTVGLGSAAGRPTDASDLVLEKAIGRPVARPLWCEMKDNAALAFAQRRGGDLLLEGICALMSRWGESFELHLVGHSAGSIWLGHLIQQMSKPACSGLQNHLRSTHLFAPACSLEFANSHYACAPHAMQGLHMEILSEANERHDNVGSPYRKSLLYLVSNALESDLRTPLLGLASIYDDAPGKWNGNSDTMEALAAWRQALGQVQTDPTDRIRIQSDAVVRTALNVQGEPTLASASHGGFDNDVDVITRTLQRITGWSTLPLPVDDLRGF